MHNTKPLILLKRSKTNSRFLQIINPAKSPIFYGYIILLVGTIGVYFSIPGQTIGVSVFTDPVKDALGLTRNQFSNAYMIGTILSSLTIGRAGVWFDKYGAVIVAFGAAVLLGITVLLCSVSTILSESLATLLNSPSWWIPFGVMIVLFYLLRFSGQGVLTMASRNVIMIWFDAHRGKVNMFTSIALSFGFSSSPLWINYLIEGHGWQQAWQFMGIALLCFSILILLFYKNKPEDHGLHPDGKQSTKPRQQTASVNTYKQFTLKEAKQTRAFWVYGLMLAFNSFFITGLTFHVISIFTTQGYEKEDAIAIFLPASVISVCTSTLFNWLSDKLQLKTILNLMQFGGIICSIGFLILDSKVGVLLLILGFGLMGGLFAVLNTVTWPRFYGRDFLGAITSRVMSFLILGSALAPSLFSLCYSYLGSYNPIGYLGLAFVSFLVVASVHAKNPQ